MNGEGDGGWVAATASVRGASHERTGKPNQDAVRVLSVGGSNSGLVAAVCDGHGGDRYVRSDTGSRFGVEVACEVGRSVLVALGEVTDNSLIEQHLVDEAVPAIVRQWRERVERHVSGNPFTTEEEQRAGEPLVGDPAVSYGCTLVLCVASTRWVGFVQIGDGDVTTVRAGVSGAPVPGDPRLIGSETTSLCLPGAVSDARVAVDSGELPDLVVLTSDGYGNSFASPDWRRDVGPDLLRQVHQHGLGYVESQLPGWLAESAAAAGDDVTMAVLHREAATAPAAARRRTTNTSHQRRWRRLVAAMVPAAAVGGVIGWVLATGDDPEAVPAATAPIVDQSPNTTTGDTTNPVATTEVPPTTEPTPTTPPIEVEGSAQPAVPDLFEVSGSDQMLLLVGPEYGTVIFFDEFAEAPARSLRWFRVDGKAPVLPDGWLVIFGTLLYHEGSEIEIADWHAAGTSLDDQAVWVIGTDGRTLSRYDADTGDSNGSWTVELAAGQLPPPATVPMTTEPPDQQAPTPEEP